MSSVYVKPNPISDEKICVGLFVSTGGKAHFAVSPSKLKVANRLLPVEVSSSLKNSLDSLSVSIKKSLLNEKDLFFDNSLFTAEYFSYLNRNNKGLLNFSEPSTVGKSIDESEFNKLFEMYVGEAPVSEVKDKGVESLRKLTAGYLKRPIFVAKADINYVVKNDVVRSIYTARSIDFISCNGNIFAGKVVDFSAEGRTIENHLFEYRALVEGLMEYSVARNLVGKPTFIAYHNEPETDAAKTILDHAKKDANKHFELCPIDKLHDAERKLDMHPYRKFSELVI